MRKHPAQRSFNGSILDSRLCFFRGQLEVHQVAAESFCLPRADRNSYRHPNCAEDEGFGTQADPKKKTYYEAEHWR